MIQLPLLSEVLDPSTNLASETQSFLQHAEQEGRVVRKGAEFRRIAALPRRVLRDKPRSMTEECRRPHGTQTLRTIQANALEEAVDSSGLFAPIGVGQGKTLIGLLLAYVLDAERLVYLTTPGLVSQLKRDMDRYNEDWWLHKEAITIVSYSQLSTAKGVDLLENLLPQVIFADEVHYLRHASAARTKRFLRYMAAHPETIFCAASGTITSRSIKDYAHLCSLALREMSPVPRSPSVAQEWALALDAQLGPNEKRNAPGALLEFCASGETPRAGFRRRLVETPGVVATTESALGTGLEIRGLRPPMPECVTLVQQCSEQGAWNGIELDPMRLAAVERQLALGFHYEWDWPGEPDREWLSAKNAWSRAVRDYLATDPSGADSPLLVANAAARGAVPSYVFHAWQRWVAVKDRPEPPTVPIWHNHNELIDEVREWLEEARTEQAIIWYEHTAVAEMLATMLPNRFVWVQPGDDPALCAGKPLLLSIKAHGTGRNLQAWSRNLVLTPPASGATWEQLIARTHRPGQTADTVTFDVLHHTPQYCGALARSKKDAEYIQTTTGQVQKLSLATFVE